MEEQNEIVTDDKFQGIVENARSIGSRYEFSVQIDPKFHRKISSVRGGTKKWLQGETSISVPHFRNPSSTVTIKGNSKQAVLDTKLRLEDFVSSTRAPQAKQRLTHFLSIHFNGEEILSNFAEFKTAVLNDFEVHKSLLQSAEKLHLTIVMLVLPDDDHKVKAIEALNTCKEKFIDPVLNGKQLAVKISDVGVFDDENPEKARVLFGKVESPELQKISNDIARYFEEQGLIKLEPKRRDVKLHLTLMNASFYEPEDEQPGGSSANRGYRKFRERVNFNATGIIERFKDFNFGTMTVNEIQISQLGDRKPGCFYNSIGALAF